MSHSYLIAASFSFSARHVPLRDMPYQAETWNSLVDSSQSPRSKSYTVQKAFWSIANPTLWESLSCKNYTHIFAGENIG